MIDNYDVREVEAALRQLKLTANARAMLVAHASAPNRAMSRLELARSMGSESVNSCNGTYGNFAKMLAQALDPTLIERWKPKSGGDGDFVMFLHFGPGRWTDMPDDEPDTWVFVMRDRLAQAIANVGMTGLTPLDEERWNEFYGDADCDDEYEGEPNPLEDINDARDALMQLSETEREALILARMGQGRFREALLDYWDERCSVTAISVECALVASHIKPWREASNFERLDVFNGLLLVGTLDRLFDGALITFDDAGQMLVSTAIADAERKKLGIDRPMRLSKVDAAHLPYLRAHRKFFEEQMEA
ncbi:MAG: HNH endonuclease [Gemmatimonas sp.]